MDKHFLSHSPFLTEANIERELDMLRLEIREEAFKEGFKEGFIGAFKETYKKTVLKSVAANMLKENLPLPLIARITSLTEQEILTIADSLGLDVM